MKITTKLAIATAFTVLAACGGNQDANNADMNMTTDMNAGMTDMNTTDMNAGMTDMNATDMNATDMNAGNTTDMNAAGNTTNSY